MNENESAVRGVLYDVSMKRFIISLVFIGLSAFYVFSRTPAEATVQAPSSRTITPPPTPISITPSPTPYPSPLPTPPPLAYPQ